ncbi:MAG: HAMP domain-containing histidine kinase [Flavobacteriaceae bacterium]|nr:HAMP domain-containing histidine kinase [Flavobacteriaceae bacterium]
MNTNHYRWLLYTILIVILSTITIQVYWNYKNYKTNKQQLINDVQVSLDKAVDDYYANLAERTTVGFAFEGNIGESVFNEGSKFQELIGQIDEAEKEFKNLDSIDVSELEGVTVLRGKNADSMMLDITSKPFHNHDSVINKLKSKSLPDIKEIGLLTSKVVISINNDALILKEVDSLLNNELKRKQLNIKYKLTFKAPNDSIKQFSPSKLFIQKEKINQDKLLLNTFSKSIFLPKNSALKISFTNETQTILKRILGGIFLSTLLVIAVISCLFYLLKIIRDQKQLAEVKNDLISNITHEFKTPISTIGVALESIKDFDVIDDKEKTKNYLDISTNQLSKLNLMVEKLLETATLDSENLQLNKEDIELNSLIETIVKKHQLATDKQISFSHPKKEIIINGDAFHLDNAINNIIDNAVKYGGENIEITLDHNLSLIKISIKDNGTTLSEANKTKIFEKFYRVPKGNTHDVKGFGIGLYYSKKIIEKHNGTISIKLEKDCTIFKLSIPNG